MKLKILFQKILEENVTIELKNGVYISGLIVDIDKHMNIYFKNAKRTLNERNTIFIDHMFIRGNKIRYIILPNWFNFDSVFFKSKQNFRKL
ncbi:small nuclear ribonucleoprotein D1 (nucleomorph) [Chroomonas mesostigmatica CCMP1168]|uniref:Small nuclear ribonucleoprotein D1 n=1 Tax=Chroomonas mesostigmatica CCMP1168 TaxID=1195612 RepID=J7G3I2_9CRYP|nr:small nuclear ribonucleoprotein D1 [Chroomonas mesostigmatica CCMP1168]|mmetsp:Transcript_58806/g.144147  ORF Transcript_58806/g.144147 Transcript_58806/m.144147 type:complete len:91 (+) Transcript_58806:418-690(+)